MYFGVEDDDDDFLGIENPELYQLVSRELYALGSQLDIHSYTRTRVPTHTEDGIPIRKLYVSNLPPKTTRTELFGVFAQYGFIKSCWLRMEAKGPNKNPTPTYAFVTYSNPADAHAALEAPCHEKLLRGRSLQTSPADSWHQPAQDANGRVRWKPRQGPASQPHHQEPDAAPTESTSEQDNPTPETSNTENPELEVPVEETEGAATPEGEESYTIMDILNNDCLTLILSYIPIADLIRSERVSKRWQSIVQDYLNSIRTFKTTWWDSSRCSLTTAVLRRVLARTGASLARLHIDNHWGALNDRTAHTVGKFCPNLDEIKITGMHTKNWNPLIYGCKQLRVVSFISCSKLTDTSLVQIVKNDSCVESLTVANNTHVTGLFLTGSRPPKLNSLAFYNCYSLQGTVLCAAIDTMHLLTTLKLDCCPVSMWKIIPFILNKLPRLKELSLSDYVSVDLQPNQQQNSDAEFAESLGNLTELKVLNLFKNIYVTNTVLKQVAQSCLELESLNISSCNSRRSFAGVGDEGILAVCSACRSLMHLNVSYLEALTDAGLRALTKLPRLNTLISRGNPTITASPFAAAIAQCHSLQEVDVCGCDSVSDDVAEAAWRALETRPRRLTLQLAATAAVHAPSLPTHKLLLINVDDDLSNPNLRPDFIDNNFEEGSEDSFDDLFDQDNFDALFRGGHVYLNSDDELFTDEEVDENYEGIYGYGRINGQDIILL